MRRLATAAEISDRAERTLLAGAVLLACALRFTALDARGWWRDEAVTVELLRLPFGSLLRAIPRSEGTPPLYYVLAWGWTRIFGDSEAGLRSLSAFFGTVTVIVVFLVARQLVSRRAGVTAAYFAAASPFLVWHAQDARAYSLLVLLTALSFLFFVRVGRRYARSDAVGFALASSLALLTHYFAVFLVAPEAVWLVLQRSTRRLALVPVAIVAAVALSLLPLVDAQRGNVSWIADVSRARRFVEVPQEFLVGPQAPWERATTVLAGLIVAAAMALFALRGSRAEWRCVRPALVVGLAAIAFPLVLVGGGLDYVLGRNLIVAWVPLAIVVAAGLSTRRAGAAGVTLAVAVVALGVGIVAGSASMPKFGAEDWRGAAHALGPAPAGGRAIVLWPDAGREPFLLYRPDAHDLPPSGADASEVVLLTFGSQRRDRATIEALSPPPPFRQSERRDERYFTLVRFDADRALAVTPTSLVSDSGRRPAVLYER
jgi:mannosyltransferase